LPSASHASGGQPAASSRSTLPLSFLIAACRAHPTRRHTRSTRALIRRCRPAPTHTCTSCVPCSVALEPCPPIEVWAKGASTRAALCCTRGNPLFYNCLRFQIFEGKNAVRAHGGRAWKWSGRCRAFQETDRKCDNLIWLLTAAGMPSQRNQSESFRFKRASFYQGLKSKVGLAAAKAAALRINLNVQGGNIVAAPIHAPSRTSLLLPLLLSHNLPLPRVH
jgi:hypothetical protein